MRCTRRSFLGGLAATATTLACDDPLHPVPRRIERVGIHLSAVGTELARDPRGTLERLARIGYRDVETSGSYGPGAAQLRAWLDETKLEARSAHFPLPAFDQPETFSDARIVGHRYLTVSSPGTPAPVTVNDWRILAEALDRAATKTESRGFRFAYYGHAPDLAMIGDKTALEILLENTEPAVSFEMDVYGVVKGGGDPLAILTRFPTRFSMLHIKDSSGAPAHEPVDLGTGTIDFQSLLAQTGTFDGYFVEHDGSKDPFATAAAGYRYLSSLTL